MVSSSDIWLLSLLLTALGLGAICAKNSALVCDGTRGLECGDMCDTYSYDISEKVCTCSQMHDRVGDECLPSK